MKSTLISNHKGIVLHALSKKVYLAAKIDNTEGTSLHKWPKNSTFHKIFPSP